MFVPRPLIDLSKMTDRSHSRKEDEIVRLFNELLPWTFNSRALINAARHGRTAECEDLIRLGVDINESDDEGNTALWISYFHEHLDTLFTLLQFGANPDTRSGDALCSDLHRACSFGDLTLTEILIACGASVNLTDRRGKTPLIYALEYPSSTCTFDLISYLIEHGAEVDHRDEHGLTSLHYACYRGDYQAVLLLIEHRADPSVQNNMGYNSLRYALSCLSYASPSQSNQYNNRLRIVDRLIEHYSNHASLVRAIRGVDHEPINLFSLMDLVFYSLIRQRDEFERLAWRVSLVIKRDQELIDYVQAIFQNSFVHSHYFAHLMYLGQRCFLVNPVAIVSYYLEHVASDAQPNRFDLLLYLIYIDQGISSLRTIDACFRRQLNHHRQWLLRYFIDEYGEKPAELKFFCRRAIRQELLVGIHCRLDRLPLTSHLKAYLLIDELDP